MKLISWVDKKLCIKCAEALRTEASCGGIGGFDGIDGDTCLMAARRFEAAAENNGEYLSNILKTGLFTLSDQAEIAEYL